MKKVFFIFAILTFAIVVSSPLSALAHEGEHDDDHGKGQHHGMMEEGSGSAGGEYRGHDGKEYKGHGKQKGEYMEEGSAGMNDDHGKAKGAHMEEGSGSEMKQSDHRERKREGS